MRRIASLSVLTIALLAHASAPPQAPAPQNPTSTPAGVQILDGRTAASLGLRHVWQVGLPKAERAGWDGVSLNKASAGENAASLSEVSVWDAAGVVLCVDGTTGKLRWQSQPTSVPQRYESVNGAMIEGRDLLLAVGDHRLVAFDRNSGEVMGVSPYRHNPATAAVSMGNMLAFGAKGRNLSLIRIFEEDVPKYAPERQAPGRINGLPKSQVARKDILCNEVRSIGLKGKPAAAPVRAGNGVLLQTSEDGEVCVLEPSSGRKIWQMQVPGKIATAAAIADGWVFMGADDQYLRCLDLETGKVRWKWFALAPLNRPILATSDLVFTQVPGTGLVALRTAVTGDKTQNNLDGEIAWKSESVTGDPVTRIRDGVLVWDAATRTLSLVDHANGKVRQSVGLPAVTSVTCSSPIDGDLILLEESGRMQRCSAAEPMPKPAVKTEEPKPEEAAPATPPAEEAAGDTAASGSSN